MNEEFYNRIEKEIEESTSNNKVLNKIKIIIYTHIAITVLTFILGKMLIFSRTNDITSWFCLVTINLCLNSAWFVIYSSIVRFNSFNNKSDNSLDSESVVHDCPICKMDPKVKADEITVDTGYQARMYKHYNYSYLMNQEKLTLEFLKKEAQQRIDRRNGGF